jgi:hypothetical protein
MKTANQLVHVVCVDQTEHGFPNYANGMSMSRVTSALQKFYNTCFWPVWGYRIKLRNATKAAPTKPDEWQIIYLDDADAADALGYHDLTKDGQPYSKVFTKTTVDDGEVVSVTTCHELCEMVLDPVANLWADDGKGNAYAYEACDAVEEDVFNVDGVAMSNFVTPAYFEPFKHPDGTKFDFLGKLSAPFTMTKGGYSIVDKGGKVGEIFGSKDKERRFAKEDRRFHRVEYRK